MEIYVGALDSIAGVSSSFRSESLIDLVRAVTPSNVAPGLRSQMEHAGPRE